ncbi:MAG: hypothetical protein CO001_02435 [Candidatus Portnoybacteria bacterium CG_4_8_14_3_um_filter_40_10]|uniref:DUF7670 domain-containing protein n=3 Tax=Candidatus Portnoyibacteriota TaxID=1817913 RepID=A0A2M7II92_9BACT|nr:MAG: hypothetical protein CO001_02435 [Candidatus Portnoybacteria bacterium CG_4_8_14_3_um_filter_40_10]PIY75131.1 MAG: hypothetical protein COY85_01145 [Candidatus Portnoybacteria bacterium CG_4_10_14_0_8_um_filter_40_50]PJA64996.1 MAG: hypothetical protein CO159_00090 [Candidatus Portnoybacteria bacterium CG_4_9_14_3_um_filter_40_10]
MEKKINGFIYWTPRILSIMFLGFLALFSLDVIAPGLSFWEIVGGLFMHNIPVFILLIILLISWKREIVGGIIFLMVGVFFTVRMLTTIMNQFELSGLSQFIIAGPAFLIGILFIINWFKKRRSLSAASAK